MSGDPEQDYFVDGFSEIPITEFAAVGLPEQMVAPDWCSPVVWAKFAALSGDACTSAEHEIPPPSSAPCRPRHH